LRLNERRVLALELLRDAGAPALGEHRRHRVGEDLLLAVLDAVEDARATSSGAVLGMGRCRTMSVSIGPGSTAWTLTPCPASSARSDWVSDSEAALETE